MSKVYFKKSGVSRPLANLNGTRIRFELLADDHGVIALDPENSGEKLTIDALTKYQERKIGGVTGIDEATYLSLKKNLVFHAPAPPELVKLFDPEQASGLNRVKAAPAPVAQEVVFAKPAVDESNVGSAKALVAPESAPAVRRQPRVGKAHPAQPDTSSKPANNE